MKRLIKTALIVVLAISLSANGIALTASAVPNDSMFGSQWGHSNTGQQIRNGSGTQGIDANILNAWDITNGSSSVIVGILDTGIDINHEDLSGIFYTNPGEIASNGIDDDHNGYIDDVNGWDFANDDNTVYDNATDDSHGTALAGVIAAVGNNSKGICGVAPNVKILPLKFRNGMKVTSSSNYDIIEAISYAKALGVKIINCSFTCYNSPELKDAMEKSGMLFVCAPGNGSDNLDNTSLYPCSYDLPNILGVASVNNKGELSTFSGYGTSVQLAAPGENIISPRPGNQYSFSSGTSLSVPYVTGVAALIQSYKPDLGANEIAEIIKSSVRPMNSLKGKTGTGGMLDAYNALKYSASVIANNAIDISLSGTAGIDDWYRSDVTITLKTTESSKLNILYSFDEKAWQKYDAPIVMKKEGKTNFFYYMEDENKMKGKVEKKEIKIDKSIPVIKLLSPKNGDTFTLGSNIALQYYVDEEISGVKGTPRTSYNVDYIPASKVGANTLKLTAEDKAGNTSALDVKYKVVYKSSVIMEPKEGKILKCGTPLLVKFSLSKAEDAIVDSAKAQLYTSFINIGTAVKETAAKSSISTNTSNSFTFDKALKQYTYSLSTKGFKPGKWQLRIELDDGTSKFVNVVLK